MKNKRTEKREFFTWLLLAAVLELALLRLYLLAYETTILWENLVTFGLLAAPAGLLPGLLGFFVSRWRFEKRVAGSVVRGVVCAAVSEALLFGLLAANASFFDGCQNKLFAGTAFALISLMTLCLLFLLVQKKAVPLAGKRALASALLAAVLVAAPVLAVLGAVATMNRSVSAVGFTDGDPIAAQPRDYCFDNHRLLIGGYCCGDGNNDAQLAGWAREAGLDFLISDCTDEAFLSACDRETLGILLSQPGDSEGTLLPRSFQTATPAIYEKWSSFTAADYAASPLYSHPCIWGNSFVDEPFLPELESIAAGIDNYYMQTEGKLPLVNLVPFTSSKNLGLETDLHTLRSLPLLNRVDWINDTVARYKLFLSDYINRIDTDYLCFDIYPLQLRAASRCSQRAKPGCATWICSPRLAARPAGIYGLSRRHPAWWTTAPPAAKPAPATPTPPRISAGNTMSPSPSGQNPSSTPSITTAGGTPIRT